MSTPHPEPKAMGRREERTAASRARILDAAVACLVESGYAGATTLRIQARAGVSRGRLLHHFPSRDQLLVAASRHLALERMRADRAALPAARSVASGAPASGAPTSEAPGEAADLAPHLDLAERLDLAVERMWASFSEPYFWAAVELWTAARTNEELRAALLPEEREVNSVIRANLAASFGPELTAHPRYAAVRDLLLSSMRGVGLTYALDHRDPVTDPHLTMWKDLARTLLAPA